MSKTAKLAYMKRNGQVYVDLSKLVKIKRVRAFLDKEYARVVQPL